MLEVEIWPSEGSRGVGRPGRERRERDGRGAGEGRERGGREAGERRVSGRRCRYAAMQREGDE